MKNITFLKIFLLAVILVAAGAFSLLHSNYAYAASNVTFTEDTILDLEGLNTTVYIEAGSEMGEVTVSGKEATFNGINNLVLKTDTHRILEIPSTGDTFDLKVNSDYFTSDGFLTQWEVLTSAGTEDFIVNTQKSNTYYSVVLDGTALEDSPFNSGSDAKISLSLSQAGMYNMGEGCGKRNVRGWGWSDNVGWVSFSCLNEYNEGEGIDYGVNVDQATGDFSGYAWSDSVGWISFNQTDLSGCPHGDCVAQLDIDAGEVTGWAKVLNSNEWISLAGSADDGSDYQVTLQAGQFHGYAWGDDSVGWLSFNCQNQGECSTSDYQVWTTLITRELAVRTDEATDTRSQEGTSVTLNGYLLSMGDDDSTDVWFEWGESEYDLTNETIPQVVDSAGGFQEEISFGEPQFGNTYYFRAMGENKTGTSEGTILDFTITKSEGEIILRHEDQERGIKINESGTIEIVE